MIEIFSLPALFAPKSTHKDLFLRDDIYGDDSAAIIIGHVFNQIDDCIHLTLFVPSFVHAKRLRSSLVLRQNGKSLEFELIREKDHIVINFQVESRDDITVDVDGATQVISLSKSMPSAFDGKNTGLLLANQNTPRDVADWINYHQKTHNLEAVAIIDRVSNGAESEKLAKALAPLIDPKIHVCITALNIPLGKEAPSEKTIWMAPSAPGKEKMTEPPIDLWHSELSTVAPLAILRHHLLKNARAIIHLHVSDLLPMMSKPIFDLVTQDKFGYFPLLGQRTYPWRVRKDEVARHADHVMINFGDHDRHRAWAIDPNGVRKDLPWSLYRVGPIARKDNKVIPFWRMMGLRHIDQNDNNPTLAPRTALIRDDMLISTLGKYFDHKPVDPPQPVATKTQSATKSGRRLIVTTMKNEGPFIVEWLAYHRAIGFDDFIVFTNDCEDGTDQFFDLLHDKGIVEHRQNPYREVKLKPQHAALFDAQNSELYKNADWKICMDVDEYINIKIGDGRLDDLFEAIGDANMISMTWRLIGNSGVVKFADQPIISQFDEAAHPITRFPHQAWGVKTLYRDLGFFKKMGVHRPKGLLPEKKAGIKWVNGSGKQLPETFYRTAWRTGTATVGYDLVELNHYAVRSMESFLVKRDRGRVNHVERDQGLQYWFRMNHNVVKETSIMRNIPMFEKEREKLMSDPEIAKMHQKCVDAHRAKIDQLLTTEAYQNFFAEINSPRLQALSRYTNRFGMNVFELGPDTVTEEALRDIQSGKIPYYNVNPEGNAF